MQDCSLRRTGWGSCTPCTAVVDAHPRTGNGFPSPLLTLLDCQFAGLKRLAVDLLITTHLGASKWPPCRCVLHICKSRVVLPCSQVTQIYGVRCSCPACHCTPPNCCPPGRTMNNLPSTRAPSCWDDVQCQANRSGHTASCRPFATDSCYLGPYLCPLCSVGYVQSFPFSHFSVHTRHCNLCFGSLPNDRNISSIFISSQLFILHRVTLAAARITNWVAEPSPQTLTEKARWAALVQPASFSPSHVLLLPAHASIPTAALLHFRMYSGTARSRVTIWPEAAGPYDSPFATPSLCFLRCRRCLICYVSLYGLFRP